MEQDVIQNILAGDKHALHIFLNTYDSVFTFPDLDYNNRREKLWEILFDCLTDHTVTDMHTVSLSAIRILSRDKTKINELVTEERMQVLQKLAGLTNLEVGVSGNNQLNHSIELEALKCLSNVVYNSVAARKICFQNSTVDNILIALRNSNRDISKPADIKLFSMRLLFLITALNAETCPRLRNELHGLTYLTETLDLTLKDEAGELGNDTCAQSKMEGQSSLTDEQVSLSCEVLKVLFNITRHQNKFSVDEEEETQYMRLVSVLQDLLLSPVQNPDKRTELHSNIINLLTCVPACCYKQLVPKVYPGLPTCCYKQLVPEVYPGHDVYKDLEYDGYSMETIHELLMFLEARLNNQTPIGEQLEQLSPVLTVLTQCARHVRVIRKYLRLQVLPPLKDVHHRPEEGTAIRNHLCRLLTTPVTHIRDLVADFLFVLCKESVNRMIKYTGYGNAAGLLANRGLLGAREDAAQSCFSSDSEDSDTEEYKEYRHGINPVVGCYEAPKPNPTDGMTEEQKEYEAMQLVNLMEQLTQSGVIKPCRIGNDGRPEPIEHISQLQRDLPLQQIRKDDSDDE